jgi:AcrR family transcriptional regulator
MGRKAGVTPDETRAALLKAAAIVFAQSGYDGASIAAISKEAGLSSGSIYAHYASKADLFVAVLDAHLSGEMRGALGAVEDLDVTELIAASGSRLDRRRPRDVSLLVEAIVASKRDDDVADAIRPRFTAREAQFASLIAAGQAEGQLDGTIAAESIARLATMLGLGSLLIGAVGLPDVDHDDWTAMIARVVAAFAT